MSSAALFSRSAAAATAHPICATKYGFSNSGVRVKLSSSSCETRYPLERVDVERLLSLEQEFSLFDLWAKKLNISRPIDKYRAGVIEFLQHNSCRRSGEEVSPGNALNYKFR